MSEVQTKYSFILRNLHMIGGLAFIAALGIGLVMEEFEDTPAFFQYITLHKSFGLAVLGLAAFRLLEWMRTSQPAALDTHANWEKVASKSVKVGLYFVMIGLPISGILMSWSAGYPAAFFGLFEIAPMIEKSKALGGAMHETHEILVSLTYLLLAMHVGGAIKHHILDKDSTLSRISPFSRA